MSGPYVAAADITTAEVAPADPALKGETFADVIVPLGNWATAELALAPAAEVARLLGARLHLLSVAIEQAEAEEMARRLIILAEGFGATAETRVDFDVAAVILEVAQEHDPALVCMASHGRGRLGEAVLGSYTTGVLATTRMPVMLAGPALDPGRRLADGPVVACVDGSKPSEAGLPAAVAWAMALGAPLEILTVAPPGPDRLPSGSGPGADNSGRYPRGYVDALVRRWARPGLQVTGRTIRDAAPADAIISHVEAAPAGLLVVTTHARTGLRRIAFGSVASTILRTSPVPVLAVPPPER